MNRRPILILSLMLLAGVVWASGCGEDTTEPTPPPEPPRATAITVAPATTELTALGATAQLSAEVRDQNGQVIAGATVTWASSSPEVAAVDAAGLVTAASNGAATITASAGTASGSAAVTVAQEASALVVSPAADKVPVGDTVRLEAEVRDANGHTVAGDASVTWSSSDPSVATVDGSGLVSGVALGTATITAVSASLQGTAQVTVAAVAAVERDALVALYESTGGDDWDINRGWLSGGPLSTWHGVETNSDGQVVELYLFDNSLSGSLPPEIGNLTELRTLTLLLNDLSGSLPPVRLPPSRDRRPYGIAPAVAAGQRPQRVHPAGAGQLGSPTTRSPAPYRRSWAIWRTCRDCTLKRTHSPGRSPPNWATSRS